MKNRNKKLISSLLMLLLLSACEAGEKTSAPKESSTPVVTAGKYQSEDGDLEIKVTEGMILFDLLVVSKEGRTGEMKGEIALKENRGIYENKSQDCLMKFQFEKERIEVQQEGSCEMGMGVTATGSYKSVAKKNANLVIGKVGDSLGSLFYGKDEKAYKKYCHAGAEEESGKILCKAKFKDKKESNIIHIFSGEYNGPDGVLPPLEVAKKFTISQTR